MPTKVILSLLSLVLLLAASSVVFAQAGSLDPDFGLGGLQTWSAAIGDSEAFGMVVQDDGKIVVVGRTLNAARIRSLLVLRFLSDGSLDPTFGEGGVARPALGVEIEGVDVAVSRAGLIYIAGTVFSGSKSDIAVVGLNRFGALMQNFGDGGLARADYGPVDSAAAILLRGGIFVAGRAGSSQAGVVKFTSGEVDTRFGDNGWVVLPGYNFSSGEALVSQGNRIIVASRSNESDLSMTFTLTRLIPSNGKLDPRFGEDGVMHVPMAGEYNHPYALAVQNDRRIVIGGTALTELDGYKFGFAVARVEADGSGLDLSFADDGVALTDFEMRADTAWDVMIEPTGKIVAVGRANATGFEDWDFTVMRFLDDGQPDLDFGTNGLVQTGDTRWEDAWAVAAQSDGKIVVAGTSYLDEPVFVEGLPIGESEVLVARYLGTESATREVENLFTDLSDSVVDGGVDVSVGRDLMDSLELSLSLLDQGQDGKARRVLTALSDRLQQAVTLGLIPADRGLRWAGWAATVGQSL